MESGIPDEGDDSDSLPELQSRADSMSETEPFNEQFLEDLPEGVSTVQRSQANTTLYMDMAVAGPASVPQMFDFSSAAEGRATINSGFYCKTPQSISIDSCITVSKQDETIVALACAMPPEFSARKSQIGLRVVSENSTIYASKYQKQGKDEIPELVENNGNENSDESDDDLVYAGTSVAGPYMPQRQPARAPAPYSNRGAGTKEPGPAAVQRAQKRSAEAEAKAVKPKQVPAAPPQKQQKSVERVPQPSSTVDASKFLEQQAAERERLRREKDLLAKEVAKERDVVGHCCLRPVCQQYTGEGGKVETCDSRNDSILQDQAYLVVKCSEGCNMSFHHRCWRTFREQYRQVHHEFDDFKAKDVHPCITDNCGGFIESAISYSIRGDSRAVNVMYKISNSQAEEVAAKAAAAKIAKKEAAAKAQHIKRFERWRKKVPPPNPKSRRQAKKRGEKLERKKVVEEAKRPPTRKHASKASAKVLVAPKTLPAIHFSARSEEQELPNLNELYPLPRARDEEPRLHNSMDPAAFIAASSTAAAAQASSKGKKKKKGVPLHLMFHAKSANQEDEDEDDAFEEHFQPLSRAPYSAAASKVKLSMSEFPTLDQASGPAGVSNANEQQSATPWCDVVMDTLNDLRIVANDTFITPHLLVECVDIKRLEETGQSVKDVIYGQFGQYGWIVDVAVFAAQESVAITYNNAEEARNARVQLYDFQLERKKIKICFLREFVSEEFMSALQPKPQPNLQKFKARTKQSVLAQQAAAYPSTIPATRILAEPPGVKLSKEQTSLAEQKGFMTGDYGHTTFDEQKSYDHVSQDRRVFGDHKGGTTVEHDGKFLDVQKSTYSTGHGQGILGEQKGVTSSSHDHKVFGEQKGVISSSHDQKFKVEQKGFIPMGHDQHRFNEPKGFNHPVEVESYMEAEYEDPALMYSAEEPYSEQHAEYYGDEYYGTEAWTSEAIAEDETYHDEDEAYEYEEHTEDGANGDSFYGRQESAAYPAAPTAKLESAMSVSPIGRKELRLNPNAREWKPFSSPQTQLSQALSSPTGHVVNQPSVAVPPPPPKPLATIAVSVAERSGDNRTAAAAAAHRTSEKGAFVQGSEVESVLEALAGHMHLAGSKTSEGQDSATGAGSQETISAISHQHLAPDISNTSNTAADKLQTLAKLASSEGTAPSKPIVSEAPALPPPTMQTIVQSKEGNGSSSAATSLTVTQTGRAATNPLITLMNTVDAVHVTGCNEELLEKHYRLINHFKIPTTFFLEHEKICTQERSLLVVCNMQEGPTCNQLEGIWFALSNSSTQIEWIVVERLKPLSLELYRPILQQHIPSFVKPRIPMKLHADAARALVKLFVEQQAAAQAPQFPVPLPVFPVPSVVADAAKKEVEKSEAKDSDSFRKTIVSSLPIEQQNTSTIQISGALAGTESKTLTSDTTELSKGTKPSLSAAVKIEPSAIAASKIEQARAATVQLELPLTTAKTIEPHIVMAPKTEPSETIIPNTAPAGSAVINPSVPAQKPGLPPGVVHPMLPFMYRPHGVPVGAPTGAAPAPFRPIMSLPPTIISAPSASSNSSVLPIFRLATTAPGGVSTLPSRPPGAPPAAATFTPAPLATPPGGAPDVPINSGSGTPPPFTPVVPAVLPESAKVQHELTATSMVSPSSSTVPMPPSSLVNAASRTAVPYSAPEGMPAAATTPPAMILPHLGVAPLGATSRPNVPPLPFLAHLPQAQIASTPVAGGSTGFQPIQILAEPAVQPPALDARTSPPLFNSTDPHPVSPSLPVNKSNLSQEKHELSSAEAMTAKSTSPAPVIPPTPPTAAATRAAGVIPSSALYHMLSGNRGPSQPQNPTQSNPAILKANGPGNLVSNVASVAAANTVSNPAADFPPLPGRFIDNKAPPKGIAYASTVQASLATAANVKPHVAPTQPPSGLVPPIGEQPSARASHASMRASPSPPPNPSKSPSLNSTTPNLGTVLPVANANTASNATSETSALKAGGGASRPTPTLSSEKLTGGGPSSVVPTNPSTEAATAAVPKKKLHMACPICQSQKAAYIIRDCKHLGPCLDCCPAVEERGKYYPKCLLCGGGVESMMRMHC